MSSATVDNIIYCFCCPAFTRNLAGLKLALLIELWVKPVVVVCMSTSTVAFVLWEVVRAKVHAVLGRIKLIFT
jgi:hypothetical protein